MLIALGSISVALYATNVISPAGQKCQFKGNKASTLHELCIIESWQSICILHSVNRKAKSALAMRDAYVCPALRISVVQSNVYLRVGS